MADLASTVVADGKDKPFRIVIAAVIATAVLQMMMQVGAPVMMGIAPMEPANLVTSILALPEGHALGQTAHFGLGLVGFPLGYVIFAYRHFAGSVPVRGALWGVVLWLVAMAVIVPLAGQPMFFGFGKPMIAALLAHVVYGIILAVIIGKPSSSPRA